VFLPGAGGGASFWRPVADRLTDLGPVHVFGFPGFGGLPADPDIRSLDDLFARFLEGRIAGSRIAIVSGGTHAFASERPDEVAAIIRSHLPGAARSPG